METANRGASFFTKDTYNLLEYLAIRGIMVFMTREYKKVVNA